MVRYRCEKARVFARTVRRVLPVKDIVAISSTACCKEAVFDLRAGRTGPEVRVAIENGRRLKELISEAGLRYTQALKEERNRQTHKSEGEDTDA